MNETESRSGTLRKQQIVLLFAILVLASGWVVFVSWQPPALRSAHRADPPSPYLNTRREVKYVGDAACAACHAESTESYRRHPMSSSLIPIGESAVQDGNGRRGEPLFESHGLQYSVEFRDGRVFHQETHRDASGRIVTRNEAEVQYVLGSGRQGASYLIEHDGFLFQSPLSWYSQKRKWDLSPGFQSFNYHFDRPIRPGCLFCHANRVEPRPGPINQYQPPIFQGHAVGCERCHGPGELHVASPTTVDGKDMTIINPAELPSPLRDDVCAQCHLIGDQRILRAGRRDEDYRPGLPLRRFWTVFVLPPDDTESRFVGQFEQMHESRCFRASGGRLGCVSCHNPHEFPPPAEKAAYYRGRCLECHADRGCSLPAQIRLEQGRSDDCTGCHMPGVSSVDIPHTAFTNHRIPRYQIGSGRPVATEAGTDRRDRRRLISFHRELLDADERTEIGRDLGVVLCRDGPSSARVALPLLEVAVAARPDDVTAWESKAYALGSLGRYNEAAAAFRKALAEEPGRESALVGAAYLAVQMDRRKDAAAYWQRAIAINPWRSDYHAELALVYFHDRNWKESADACRRALQLNASWVDVRRWLLYCYLNLANTEAARGELEIILGFDPPDRADLLRAFSAALQSGSRTP